MPYQEIVRTVVRSVRHVVIYMHTSNDKIAFFVEIVYQRYDLTVENCLTSRVVLA